MSKSERNFIEAAMEAGEAGIDLLTDNEAVKAVPVVGLAFKLLKGLDDLRSRILMAKLKKFITEPNLVRSLEANRVRAQLDRDKDRELIGEVLFLTLDKVTDLRKPELLGRVFSGYLDEIIGSETLLLLAHAIDSAFVGDLEFFLGHSEEHVRKGNPAAFRLLSAGLVEYSDFRDTPLGKALRTVAGTR